MHFLRDILVLTSAVASAVSAASIDIQPRQAGIQRGDETLVFTEIGGVPGNECLTFRNNGEIVNAACVNEAADRQITPSTTADGQPVLLVQRSFSDGFRPDLVDKEVCVGFNGTHFRAEDCAAAAAAGGEDGSIEFVSFQDGSRLVASSGACQSGHDELAQITVDESGQDCATLTTTAVTPTEP